MLHILPPTELRIAVTDTKTDYTKHMHHFGWKHGTHDRRYRICETIGLRHKTKRTTETHNSRLCAVDNQVQDNRQNCHTRTHSSVKLTK